jgi:hypothetical protein
VHARRVSSLPSARENKRAPAESANMLGRLRRAGPRDPQRRLGQPAGSDSAVPDNLTSSVRIASVKFGGLSAGGTKRWLQMMAVNLRELFEVDYYYCDAAPCMGSYKHRVAPTISCHCALRVPSELRGEPRWEALWRKLGCADAFGNPLTVVVHLQR